MRRDGSAATAGSTQRRGGSFGDFLRGALATRASSSSFDGIGASVGGRGSRRSLGILLVPLVAFAVLAGSVASANAATQRPFKETFGSAAQPSFQWPLAVAVDPGTGDVLVADYQEQAIRRFHSDGTPSPFSALGTNLIDGREANGKPCAEEPASCDQTLQNGIEVEAASAQQIAVDDSGGPTDGNIYVSQRGIFTGTSSIDIFASNGEYLGQLTATETGNFQGAATGVAVDLAGVVYAAVGGEVHEYLPSSNVPINGDYVSSFGPGPERSVTTIALGSGPTAGSLFGAGSELDSGANTRLAYKFDRETGEVEYTFARGSAITSIATDPTTGHVLLKFLSKTDVFEELVEFDASGNSAVTVGRILGSPGHTIGDGFALSPSGEDLYVAGELGAPISVFGSPGVVPTVTADPASNVTGTKATLTGTVDPEGLEVTECFFKYGETASYGNTAPCEELIPTDSTPHPVHLEIAKLEPNGHTYHYRLFAGNANGTEESADQTFETAKTVETQAATGVGTVAAILNGTVRPEGEQYTACFFEFGISTNAGFEKTLPCSPAASGVPADFSPHAVSAAVSGLQRGTTYRFRLVATNSAGTLKGEELTFTTLGPPQITEVRASFADQDSAALEAKIDPSGFGTSYRFEWGPTLAYGNSVPVDFEPFVGSGTEPVRVNAKISNLSAGTTYHYRVVATNSVDVTESPDQLFETLNSCGLPESRCFELVSPRDAGPVAIPGGGRTAAELEFQASSASGSLAYVVEKGLPDATTGAEVLYHGVRGAGGWSSSQLSAPNSVRSETNTENSFSSVTYGLSDDLSCGVVVSGQPLTDDASTELIREAGRGNLYRHNPDGSYTAISKLPPENPGAGGEGAINNDYSLVAMSDDCGKVVFISQYRYPGIPGIAAANGNRIYEWDEGSLRSLGYVPGPSGETLVAPTTGFDGRVASINTVNLVSADGSRVFFTAPRQVSSNPEEIGKIALFVREEGTSTRDLSLSETSTPSGDATYQYASEDGSRVFFTANAGLTEESSSDGTDLYEYNLGTDTLTDLSVDHDPGGARVGGFIGGSVDGSHLYFFAQGQLVPGKGKTLAQNQSDDTYSIYGVKDGIVSYVATIGKVDLGRIGSEQQADRLSRVSPDGRYLLFVSRANVTGYESGGVNEAYLYDAEASSSESTVCVSCRQDGKISVSPSNDLYSVLSSGSTANPLYSPRSLVVRDGRPLVLFTSMDRLAIGATEGEENVYLWSHGQVFHIGTPLARIPRPRDASPDGTDLYFVTSESLSWEDSDGRDSVYDARIGGGFPEPPPPPAPCDPISEGSCQGPQSQAAPGPVPSSNSFRGPGNAKAKSHKHRKKKKKHGKKHKKKQQGKHKKRANADRRAGK